MARVTGGMGHAVGGGEGGAVQRGVRSAALLADANGAVEKVGVLQQSLVPLVGAARHQRVQYLRNEATAACIDRLCGSCCWCLAAATTTAAITVHSVAVVVAARTQQHRFELAGHGPGDGNKNNV